MISTICFCQILTEKLLCPMPELGAMQHTKMYYDDPVLEKLKCHYKMIYAFA